MRTKSRSVHISESNNKGANGKGKTKRPQMLKKASQLFRLARSNMKDCFSPNLPDFCNWRDYT